MKNFITSLLLVLLTFTLLLPTQQIKAQTVGVLIQPNFDSNNTAKGFFAQTQVYNRIGLYADYKFNKDTEHYIDGPYQMEFNDQLDQLNLGVTYLITDNIEGLVSTSVINKQNNLTVLYEPETQTHMTDKQNNRLHQLYQVGFIAKAGYLSALVAYETNKEFIDNRITFGIGVNF